MKDRDRFNKLTEAYQAFSQCIQSVPDKLFLSPMNGWSPRDTAAHLVGWNRLMIESGRDIQRGRKPLYYTDAPHDYKNINALFVSQYSTRDKASMLTDLAASMKEFEDYLHGLAPAELETDHGVVHYSGVPATVARLMDSLTGDYQTHTRKIQDWLRTKGQQAS